MSMPMSMPISGESRILKDKEIALRGHLGNTNKYRKPHTNQILSSVPTVNLQKRKWSKCGHDMG